MIKTQNIMELVQRRIGRVLDVAEVGIGADRFPAFRKVVLKEFGKDGLSADIERLLRETADGSGRNGTGRNEEGEKGGAP
jgi:hypothetical protein